MVCRSHASPVKTALMPLSSASSAVVFINQDEPNCEPVKLKIKEFFSAYGIAVSFVSAYDADLRTDSDIFLSLNPVQNIDECYAARSSRAKFKIGRHQLKWDTYDLVVSDPEPEAPSPVGVAFEAIRDMLSKIQ
ncbi:MAG: hypothetical protein J5871_07200 [Bacteroidales bacterium]|nr:hypothetical protein [Bacteroidales bacterium]